MVQNTRLKNEITWNRTANLRGGPGHNIPLDLVNEFLNRDFKGSILTNAHFCVPETLKQTRGNLPYHA